VLFEDLPVIAEAETPSGEHWYLRAGGTPDYYRASFMVYYASGHGGGGAMEGRALPAEAPFQYCISQHGKEPLTVMLYTESRVRRLRLRSPKGQTCDLQPVAEDTTVGLTFFVALLPWKGTAIAMEGLDASGELLHQHELHDR
jgi:hypothetical protein